jgi:hypothetical protein
MARWGSSPSPPTQEFGGSTHAPFWIKPDSTLTDRDVDDASQVKPLLDRIAEPVEIFMGNGGYDRTGVYTALDEHRPERGRGRCAIIASSLPTSSARCARRGIPVWRWWSAEPAPRR